MTHEPDNGLDGLLPETADIIFAGRTLGDICAGIAAALRRRGDMPAAAVMYQPPGESMLEEVAVRDGEPAGVWHERMSAAARDCAASRPGVAVSDASPPGQTLRVWPLRRGGGADGCIVTAGGPALPDGFADRLAVWLHDITRITSLAVHDPLTGLHNRNYIDEMVGQTLALCRRNRQPLSVMMLDIDHFKSINDELGHIFGDRLLAELASIIERNIRGSDLAFRYGGDEFLVVMPNARMVDAGEAAIRLRENAAGILVQPKRPDLCCRISIGLAEAASADGLPDLLARADAAMRFVKRAGRDNIAGLNAETGRVELLTGSRAQAQGEPAPVENGGEARFLVVDDEPTVRKVMSVCIGAMAGWRATECSSADEALAEIRARPNYYDVVLTDLRMPEQDGFALLDELDRLDASITRIIVTGYATADNAIKGVRRRVVDIIEKPFTNEALLMAAVKALAERRLKKREAVYRLDLEKECSLRTRELEKTVADLRRTQWQAITKFADMIDMREHQIGLHSKRTAKMAEIVARRMGLAGEQIENLRLGALLHDVGKIAVPDSVLLKRAPLDEDERAAIEEHVRHSEFLLKDIPFLAGALPAVLYHHESFDGSGYPHGLKGEAIPIEARILAVVDAYDAMRMERCYRNAMPEPEAVSELARCSGSRFDPEIVRAALGCLPEFEAVFVESPADGRAC